MSWDADLIDDRGHCEGCWNYTHNCNAMANAVLDECGVQAQTWWKELDGMSGPDGAAFLDLIIRGIEADSERFRAMNPENGWGDCDSFVKVLTEMRDRVPEWPCTWKVWG